MCGRAIGYQYGSPDAFGNVVSYYSLNSYYVYGVSITHGTPRNHIWTYAAGVSEGGYYVKQDNCPCSDPSNGKSPPWFSVELPNPTIDDIEVRICNPVGT